MNEATMAADAIARRLHDAGCRHAFAIPGEPLPARVGERGFALAPGVARPPSTSPSE
jgi:hypothetical protein